MLFNKPYLPRAWLFLASWLTFLSVTLAHSHQYTISPEQAIGGVIFIVGGFLFCFLGHRLFKIVLFLAGFFSIGLLVLYACIRISPPAAADSTRKLVYFIVAIVFGLLGGLLFMCFWKLGLAAIGALAGFAFSMFLLSLSNDGLINHHAGRVIFIVAFIIIGILLIMIFEKHLLLIGTSVFGGYAFILGLDFFIQTGFTQHLLAFLNGSPNSFYKANSKIYAMLASMIVIIILGVIIQYKTFRPYGRK